MIGLIDYDIGNLRSVRRALEKAGAEMVMVRTAVELSGVDAAVLPGVGAFGDCVGNLRQRGLFEPVRDFALSGKPFLGICVGLQMLFERGLENGVHEGLGLMPGEVRVFESTELKIPQIGWNTIDIKKTECPLFKDIPDESYYYFVHSYAAQGVPLQFVAAETTYGQVYPSVVWKDNIFATQFHPEKSQNAGLRLLKNFVDLTA